MRKKLKHSGIALMTAMVLVLVLFAAVTVTVANVKFGQGLTLQSAEASQASFLARAGLAVALKEVNDSAGWIGSHSSQASAATKTFPDGEFSAWAEAHPDNPSLHVLHCVGRTRGRQHHQRLIIRKEGDQKGVLFSRYERNGDTDGLYYKTSVDPNWNAIEPPPLQTYDSSGLLSPSVPDPHDYPSSLGDLAGNDKGILFARHERGSGEIDTLYRYDSSSNVWSVLPPTPNVLFDSSGNNVAPANSLSIKMTDLASGGGDLLYARTENSDPLASDTIHVYNDQTQVWGALPPVPGVTYDSGTPISAGYADSIEFLSADSQGNLYGMWQRGGVDTIYKWDGTDWTTITPPEKVRFNHAGVAFQLGGLDDQLGEMAAAPNGDLYVRGVNSSGQPDTLYKYSDGAWTPIAPPRQVRLHQGSNVLDPGQRAKDFSEITVDRDGKVYLREKKGDPTKPDVIYVWCDGEYSHLPLQKAQIYSNGSLHDMSDYQTWGGYVSSTEDIAGGALIQSGGPRYVPTMDF